MPEKLTPVTIVIPIYKEADNLPDLIQRISALSFGDRPYEVLLIDDNSGDGTVEIVGQFSAQCSWLKLIVRKNQRGLSRAVIEGFQSASYPFMIVMDADLSHHPEKIPEIIAALDHPETEMVIGSRYIAGGVVDTEWSWYRKVISRVSAWLARFLLALPIKDPLSGFIGIKKEVMHRAAYINPVGWKIGLELIVRCQCKSIVEIPIRFSERQAGSSKLTLNVGLSYLQQLFVLLMFKLKLA